jgi:hypothetical protein
MQGIATMEEITGAATGIFRVGRRFYAGLDTTAQRGLGNTYKDFTFPVFIHHCR